MDKRRYKFVVPIIKNKEGYYAPRTKEACGYRVIKYYWFCVLIEVGIGGYNYLKNRNYAIEV